MLVQFNISATNLHEGDSVIAGVLSYEWTQVKCGVKGAEGCFQFYCGYKEN